MGAKKKKKKPKGLEQIKAYTKRLEELQARSPTVTPEYLWGYLRAQIEPAVKGKIAEQVREATYPEWERARVRGEETMRLAIPRGTEELGKYFAERFRKYLSEITGKEYEKIKPTVYEDIRKIITAITSPEASVVYGMAREAPKWETMGYGEATPQILSQIEQFKRNYEEIISSLNKYFREQLGLTDFDASRLFTMVWGE